MDKLEKLQKKWEKSFEKKMTKEERVMFRWGCVYGTEDLAKEIKRSYKTWRKNKNDKLQKNKQGHYYIPEVSGVKK